MALNWDLTKIKDFETVCFRTDAEGNRKLNPVTESMIWLTMHLGIGGLTKRHAPEFAKRLNVYQGIFGPILFNESGPAYLGAEEVYAHIGLTTNVSHETRSKFMKRVWGHVDREFAASERARNKAKEEA